MRLLNTSTREFEEFDNAFPPYAILSHTWVKGEEVTLQDLQKYHEFIAQSSPASTSISSRVGFKKIEGCCDLALRDGLNYAWIDTCCIDKTSSAELSEAINSMFKWYKESDVCYAYLKEVKDATEDFSASDSSFRQSSWFKRGWTLQELLAPRKIQFFSKEWELIGQMDKFTKLCDVVSSITLIPPAYLEGEPLDDASVAQRMSWASNRKTTREEDIAYSLLGIFNVNMPLLYGEGDKAFGRLQEAIMTSTHDHTLLAWGHLPWDKEYTTHDNDCMCPVLATSPAQFRNCYDLINYKNKSYKSSHYDMTNLGLQIQLRLRNLNDEERKRWSQGRRDRVVVVLNCGSQRDPSREIAILMNHYEPQYVRANQTLMLEYANFPNFVYTDMFILQWDATQLEIRNTENSSVCLELPEGFHYEIKYMQPNIEINTLRSRMTQTSLLITFIQFTNIFQRFDFPEAGILRRIIGKLSLSIIRPNTVRLCLQLRRDGGSSTLTQPISFMALLLLGPESPIWKMECVLSPLPSGLPDKDPADQLGMFLGLKGRAILRINNETFRVHAYGATVSSRQCEMHFKISIEQPEITAIYAHHDREAFNLGTRYVMHCLAFLVIPAFSVMVAVQYDKSWSSAIAVLGPCFMPLWFQVRGENRGFVPLLLSISTFIAFSEWWSIIMVSEGK